MTEIRLSTHTNPLGLKLGERVHVRRSCVVEYNEEDERVLLFQDFNASAIVVGSVRKALGKYIKGQHYSSFDGTDYEPPSLKVDRYVRLYECKTTLEKKPFLVHPDEINPQQDPT